VVERNAEGLTLLVSRLRELASHLVTLEATGGFETVVVATMTAAGLPAVVVNPAQVRLLRKPSASGPRLIRMSLRIWPILPKPKVPR
jgi:transposase